MRVLDLTGGVLEEIANPSGTRKEIVNCHCSEFMQLVKVLLFSFFQELCTITVMKETRFNLVEFSVF